MNFWNQKLNQIYDFFEVDPDNGINSNLVEIYHKKYGLNKPPGLNSVNPIIIFLRQFKSILIIILIFVSIFSFFTNEQINGYIILIMLLVNAFVGFIQEIKAEKSLEKLRNLISYKSKVIRDGKEIEIDSKMLIPGDIVLLNMGNIVPADIKIIKANNLIINESTLTGESLPVSKTDEDKAIPSNIPQEIFNGLFTGTSIVSGSARGIVITTGKNTVLSKTVTNNSENKIPTKFEKVLSQFSNVLLVFVIILTIFVFGSNVFMGRNIVESFLLGVTVALGITPEIMPIIISISISSASLKLAKLGVLIRRLNSLEDLGNVDIICTDKTGTITNGILELNKYIDLDGKEDIEILRMASICNANHPSAHDVLFPNPIDNEIWQQSKKSNINDGIIKYQLKNIKDFDFESRIMEVTAIEGKKIITIIKGATENIVKNINNNEKEKTYIVNKAYEYEKLGNRVISIASKEEKETAFTFHGFILLRDNPKDSFDEVIELFKKLNVDIKVITGDSPIITREICREAGLMINEEEVITGIELEKLSLEELRVIVEKKRIFARVSPEQKSAIISALQFNQHVICYIGDGVNDIGAIRTADVGISVDSANDVTKSSSDIVLLKKDLSVLANGITEGRKTFDNTMKFILNTMSSSFGNVLTIAIFSLFLKFMPFLPIQVLLIDSLSDIQHISISTDNVDDFQIKKPQTWNIRTFIKFMLFFGAVGTLVDFIHVFIFQSLYTDPDYFRSVWFFESILSELLAIFIIRTKLPFFKSTASRLVIFTTVIAIALGMIIPYTSVGNNMFSLFPIDLSTFGIVLLLVILYLAILEGSKLLFYRFNK